MRLFKTRYSVLFSFIVFFLIISLLTRLIFLGLYFHKASITTVLAIPLILGKGLLYDTAVALFFTSAYGVYLLLLPEKWNRSAINKVITYTGSFLVVLIVLFAFFAEFAFWDEFESRFNFIAVDYLVYTFEVINNINQSYPLPWLISAMVALTVLVLFLFYQRNIFYDSFKAFTPVKHRLIITGSLLAAAIAACFMSNSWADTSPNHYQNELAKAGIFSFFAAFKSNELNYYDFYAKENEEKVFQTVRTDLTDELTQFVSNGYSIRRRINNPGTAQRPNVILVTIESFSADFMQHFGNTQGITPVLDSLADKSILFTNMYATGTRTVRGMEALTLCVPPTPGNSIVRRTDNDSLFTVSSIFRKAGYQSTFFYGGDGYFDNMNNYFGNNGFDICDKGGRMIPDEAIHAKRAVIPKEEIHFENAWGICDEDLYNAVIRDADRKYQHHQPFFDFVMTTSNHKPYTYPSGKVAIPSGSGREGAVEYTDYAIGQFLKKIQSAPWFNNTVIIFVADHCASSAGKNEINVSKYHIPCIIYNLAKDGRIIDQHCSQIDLFATLFGLLNWQYESNWYGQNVLLPGYQPRAWVATYQKLGYLLPDKLAVLSPQQKNATYQWHKQTDELVPQKSIDQNLLKHAVASYQTAYYLYKHGGLKE
ncbi:LTA synthase family protein [Longitalea arenae]|uniref:LTA synthase family protein n=1 Tax=Longitalea arenae TaxID=2812558 RepID=UPI001967AE60|nr:LTA synthase family protein [Longitalea arenae]